MTQAEVVNETETKIELARPKKWAIVLHNDDVTPMDFVVALLIELFRYNEDRAVELTLVVHQQGKGAVGIYPREVAEAKYAETVQTIRLNGRELKVTLDEQE